MLMVIVQNATMSSVISKKFFDTIHLTSAIVSSPAPLEAKFAWRILFGLTSFLNVK